MSRPRRGAGPRSLSEHQLRWLTDPLTQHMEPCPFESPEEAQRVARAAADHVLDFWHREYGGRNGEPPLWLTTYLGRTT